MVYIEKLYQMVNKREVQEVGVIYYLFKLLSVFLPAYTTAAGYRDEV